MTTLELYFCTISLGAIYPQCSRIIVITTENIIHITLGIEMIYTLQPTI